MFRDLQVNVVHVVCKARRHGNYITLYACTCGNIVFYIRAMLVLRDHLGYPESKDHLYSNCRSFLHMVKYVKMHFLLQG